MLSISNLDLDLMKAIRSETNAIISPEAIHTASVHSERSSNNLSKTRTHLTDQQVVRRRRPDEALCVSELGLRSMDQEHREGSSYPSNVHGTKVTKHFVVPLG